MGYKDIREWLTVIEQDGELKKISGADWNLEMGGINEIFYREGKRPVPALLFDDIPGCPSGYRTLFGLLSSPRRLARALYVPLSKEPTEIVQNWRNKMRTLKLIPPKFVDSGPVQENRLSGGDADLTIFPSPHFHELDGGRYIGTCHAVINMDPDDGWVNLGAYRCMLVDRDRLAIHPLEGQHGRMICDKYFNKREVMPVAVAIGIDPTLWFVSTDRSVPWGTSEYDYAGGIKGEPIEVIKGPFTGLPLPAHAEIVIEGECHPGDLVDEGPFGEWNGYYANFGLSPVPEPVVRVKTIFHRNDPILTCAHPNVPPSDLTAWYCMTRSAMFWDNLERLGIPGIKGVWCHDEGGSLLFTAISIRQMYAGHSRRVGLVASQVVSTISRYTVVVDEDIDPSNLSQVIWAIATRCDPERSIQILPHCGTSSADTTVSIEEKRKTKIAPKPLYSSRAIIDACQPFEWKEERYPVAQISPELRGQLIKKWKDLFKGSIAV
jgi:UbiD family decarboxylase